MPEISKHTLEGIQSDFAIFIALFLNIFRIVVKESKRDSSTFSGKWYKNPEVLITFSILIVITETSSILKHIQWTHVARIWYCLGKAEDTSLEIAQILSKQWWVVDDDLAAEFARLLKQPPVTERIVMWADDDFSEFTKILKNSKITDVSNDVIYYIKQLIKYKSWTYLSPSAVTIQEGIIGFVNGSVNIFDTSNILYSIKSTIHGEGVLKQRIEEAKNIYFDKSNNTINTTTYQNSFLFVMLATKRTIERTFNFFFGNENFSTDYKTKIKEILL